MLCCQGINFYMTVTHLSNQQHPVIRLKTPHEYSANISSQADRKPRQTEHHCGGGYHYNARSQYMSSSLDGPSCSQGTRNNI